MTHRYIWLRFKNWVRRLFGLPQRYTNVVVYLNGEKLTEVNWCDVRQDGVREYDPAKLGGPDECVNVTFGGKP